MIQQNRTLCSLSHLFMHIRVEAEEDERLKFEGTGSRGEAQIYRLMCCRFGSIREAKRASQVSFKEEF